MSDTTGGEQARWTPPRWLNRLMTRMLRTPGLQRWIGRGTALLTFTGRRTGRVYTTPVSYARTGDRVILAGHVNRSWWRNFRERPEVRLRLAGTEHVGTARIVLGDDPGSGELLRRYLDQQRMTARALRIRQGADGRLREDDIRRVLTDTVLVDIRLEPEVASRSG